MQATVPVASSDVQTLVVSRETGDATASTIVGTTRTNRTAVSQYSFINSDFSLICLASSRTDRNSHLVLVLIRTIGLTGYTVAGILSAKAFPILTFSCMILSLNQLTMMTIMPMMWYIRTMQAAAAGSYVQTLAVSVRSFVHPIG